jgi:hypothetical protein
MVCKNLKPSTGATSASMIGPPETLRTMGSAFISEATAGKMEKRIWDGGVWGIGGGEFR